MAAMHLFTLDTLGSVGQLLLPGQNIAENVEAENSAGS